MSLGSLHIAAAVTGLLLGIVQISTRKGTRRHVRLGHVYVATMLLVTVPVFFLYDATGRPGPFHAMAVVSLVTLVGGIATAPSRRGRLASERAHGTFMLWSYVGLVGAGLAQLMNRGWPDSPWSVLGTVLVVVAVSAVWIHRSMRRVPS